MDRAGLKRIADRCGLGLPLDPPDAVELNVALIALLSGQYESLDRALGIKRRRGQRSTKTIHRHELRDALLWTCARRCFGDLSVSGQAEAIVSASDRYQSSAWLIDQAKPSMPASYAGTVREYIYRVCLTGAKVPKRRRLIEVLNAAASVQANSPYSLHGDSPKVDPETRTKPDAVPHSEGCRRRNAAA